MPERLTQTNMLTPPPGWTTHDTDHWEKYNLHRWVCKQEMALPHTTGGYATEEEAVAEAWDRYGERASAREEVLGELHVDSTLPLIPEGARITTVTTMGHARMYVGLEPDPKLLIDLGPDSSAQSSLIHMALQNARTEKGRRDMVRIGVHTLKCDELYEGGYSSHCNEPKEIVWLPGDGYTQVIKALENAGEVGLAALMRQGQL